MNVEIKKIEPGRFASFYGFGKQPEDEAMTKLMRWCENRNIDLQSTENVVYGFNNPNPTSELSEYGYEFWLRVDENEKPLDDVRIIEYHGGDYATTVCGGIQTMMQTWKALYKWCVDQNHKIGHHQPLEIITGNLLDIESIRIELCCPVILNE